MDIYDNKSTLCNQDNYLKVVQDNHALQHYIHVPIVIYLCGLYTHCGIKKLDIS